MKLSTVLLLIWAACSSAATLPSCGTTCVARAIKKTGCLPSDSKCICDSEHYMGYLQYCFSKKCSPSDNDDAMKSATTFCVIVIQDNDTKTGPDDALYVQKRDHHSNDGPKPKNRIPPHHPQSPPSPGSVKHEYPPPHSPPNHAPPPNQRPPPSDHQPSPPSQHQAPPPSQHQAPPPSQHQPPSAQHQPPPPDHHAPPPPNHHAPPPPPPNHHAPPPPDHHAPPPPNHQPPTPPPPHQPRPPHHHPPPPPPPIWWSKAPTHTVLGW